MLVSIILKVKEHEEFFPAFYFLVQELLQTLGKETLPSNNAFCLKSFTDHVVSTSILVDLSDVDCLDDIMPVLRSLKSRAE